MTQHEKLKRGNPKPSERGSPKRPDSQEDQKQNIKAQKDIVSIQLCLYNENGAAFVAALGKQNTIKLKMLPKP